MTMAKSLAGGFPLAAVVGRAEVMDAPGRGGTYAGNPVSIAAANAVIDVIEREALLERSTLLGDRLRAPLRAIDNLPELAEVRGLGRMVAADFCSASLSGKNPNPAFVKAVQRSTSTPMPMSTKRCSAKRSPTARLFTAHGRKA